MQDGNTKAKVQHTSIKSNRFLSLLYLLTTAPLFTLSQINNEIVLTYRQVIPLEAIVIKHEGVRVQKITSSSELLPSSYYSKRINTFGH